MPAMNLDRSMRDIMTPAGAREAEEEARRTAAADAELRAEVDRAKRRERETTRAWLLTALEEAGAVARGGRERALRLERDVADGKLTEPEARRAAIADAAGALSLALGAEELQRLLEKHLETI
jgi:hypothetical protein